MALQFAKFFEPAQLTASVATYYTVPSSPTTTLLRNGRIRLSNTTAAPVTATVHAVPASGSAADANAIIKAYSIGANSYLDVDLPIMKAGDTLQALAGAATSISLHAIDGVLWS